MENDSLIDLNDLEITLREALDASDSRHEMLADSLNKKIDELTTALRRTEWAVTLVFGLAIWILIKLY